MTNIVTNKDGIEFDIDAIATDLNGKMDRDGVNAECPVVISRTPNSQGVVEIWSDGYCVQTGSNIDTGTASNGSVTISFANAFKDTNYTISLSLGKDNTFPDTNGTYAHTNKTVSSFQIRRFGQTTRYADYRAEGYIR